MIEPPPQNGKRASLLAMPRWLVFSVLTIGCWGAWGAVSKLASNDIDANTNQLLFTLGLLPLIAIAVRSPSLSVGVGEVRRAGIGWAFLTGILGGTGNIAFFRALVVGGQASVVVPVTALFPLVTVILALAVLRERLGLLQKIGLALALIAIYLISME
jgi:transporter family protein